MTRALLNTMQLNPGNTVLDPFIGSRRFGPELLDLPAVTIDLCSTAGFEFVHAVEKPIVGRRSGRGTESILMFIK